jgi:predicted enzyme related to lactoylglutathione lyase
MPSSEIFSGGATAMTNQVVWFDIPVRNLERAIRFYSAVLGEEVTRQEFPERSIGVLPHAGNFVSGCLYESDEDAPSEHGPLLYLNADGRLDEAVATVEEMGGKVLEPKHEIGMWGFRAVILDSEGNRIALHSK